MRPLATLLAAATIVSTGGAASAQERPWVTLTVRDLDAVHQILRDNHPGAVDLEDRDFARWLDEGLRAARRDAQTADGYVDYERILRTYLNGFRDLHTTVAFQVQPTRYVWPGFMIRPNRDGEPHVAYSNDAERFPVGARLAGCDGQDLETFLSRRVDRIYVNADIPHMRSIFLHRPFYLAAGEDDRPARCTFSHAGRTYTEVLRWTPVVGDQYAAAFRATGGTTLPPMGLREGNGVWYIRLPTFDDQERSKLEELVAAITANADRLRNAERIVFDVRHNGGGSSAWSDRIIDALWGEELRSAVRRNISARQYVEFRASPANRAIYARYIEEFGHLPAARQHYQDAVAGIDAALREGRSLARTPPGDTSLVSLPVNPVRARVYLLTDGCGSSCLDFLDTAKAIPGVTQIGRPTLADAAYTETSGPVPLPSGLAEVVYSLKVYRGRVRGHNEWHRPAVVWPGGPMTDEALATWIRGLDR